MTATTTSDTPAGFRASIIALLETLSSKKLQEQYQEEVPIANVSAELVCGWFDDLYHPKAPGFAASFREAELQALSSFHQVFESLVDSLPKTGGLQAFWDTPAWDQIGTAAAQALQAFEGA